MSDLNNQSTSKGKRIMSGPTTPDCDLVHSTKYRGDNESFREAMNRVAAALQDNHEHYAEFRSILLSMRFMPAGRIQAAMGSLKNITPYNCFVAPTIEDSFVSGENCIMDVAKHAATTMRQGGGIGYDFSTLRPKGDLIRGVGAATDGPLAFAPIFDAVCKATTSAGARRGAQMLVLRIDHPDIEQFIHAKQNHDQLTGFNLSIGVTDKFMECLKSGEPFPLHFGDKVYREVDPAALWEMIMRSTYDWGEPGILFIDRINRLNNLYYCEVIAATNPCGEQPLPPYGACLLGSFNLVKYLILDEKGGYTLDFAQIKRDIPFIVRSMDNVIDRARYPTPEQKVEAQTKRRIGLGVTGVANALEACGHPYGTKEYIDAQSEVLRTITNACYMASVKLAKEKGAFELYDADKYLKGIFITSLDKNVQAAIKKHGIRNSHLISIAPTGTISLCADNISSGIEPVFAYKTERIVKLPAGDKIFEVDDYGLKFLGVSGRTADKVTPKEHIAVLTAAQQFVDSAVSKTCNLPENIEWDDFKDIYIQAWDGGAKGCTTYRTGCLRGSILSSMDDEKSEESEGGACSINEATGARTCED